MSIDNRELERESHKYEQPSALIIHEALTKEGHEMLDRPLSGLAWSGVAAGLSIGFSVIATTILYSELNHFSWHMLLVAVGATLGYLIVILGQQGLVTESSVVGMLPVFNRSHKSRGLRAITVISVVTLFNLVGSFLVAYLIARTSLLESQYHTALTELARKTTEPGFGTLLVRGLLGGWAIALAVWTSPSAGPARVIMIFFLAYMTGLAHLSHLAAGSIESFYLILNDQLPLTEYFGKFLPAVLIGNLIGGVVMVAGLNHLQVAKQRKFVRQNVSPNLVTNT